MPLQMVRLKLSGGSASETDHSTQLNGPFVRDEKFHEFLQA
jgi:hypothetical protein